LLQDAKIDQGADQNNRCCGGGNDAWHHILKQRRDLLRVKLDRRWGGLVRQGCHALHSEAGFVAALFIPAISTAGFHIKRDLGPRSFGAAAGPLPD
jgi:hypothetical protein